LTKGQELPQKELPCWVGRRAFHTAQAAPTKPTDKVEGKQCYVACDNFSKERVVPGLRDSALSLDINRHHSKTKGQPKRKEAYFPEVQFFMEKPAKAAKPEFGEFSTLTTEQLEKWFAANLSISKNAIASLTRALTKAKVDGAKLTKLVSSKTTNAQLAALGVSKSVRSVLVRAVRKAIKGKVAKAEPKKRALSKMVQDYQNARKQEGYVETWPDMELLHFSEHARGGQQIIRTVIKAADISSDNPTSHSIDNQA